MQMMVGLLIAFALCYQMFFRYEHWPSHEQDGVVYERDNLSGETRLIKPGEKVNYITRLVGQVSAFGNPGNSSLLETISVENKTGSKRSHTSNGSEEAVLMSMIETTKPLSLPKEIIIAKEAPPVPHDPAGSSDMDHPFAVRQVDLNSDGSLEEIIQAVSEHDGLLDISIVKNGREILFHRGRDLTILPSRNTGWSDISTISGDSRTVFRYNATRDVYEPIGIPKAVARKSI